ncbi:hypothetical protein [Micromonospora sp. NPDC005173]|uniref:Rv0361 family membrane protein n=1 Tax=Micromonospora sp. NPDC005173 TaxID=3157165 RepID=UPI0033B39B1C
MTYEPMLVPDRKPNRTTRTVLIVVAAVLVVCCLGGVCGGFWLYRTVSKAVGPAREATAAYLDDVQAGNYPGAYGRLCEKVRDGMSQEEYTRIQSAQLKIRSYEITGASVSNYNGRVSGAVTVQMVQETGGRFTQTVPLAKERGEWRVCQ